MTYKYFGSGPLGLTILVYIYLRFDYPQAAGLKVVVVDYLVREPLAQ